MRGGGRGTNVPMVSATIRVTPMTTSTKIVAFKYTLFFPEHTRTRSQTNSSWGSAKKPLFYDLLKTTEAFLASIFSSGN